MILKSRSFQEVHEITTGMDWKDILLLPTWLAVERSIYECSCGSSDDDCRCKPDLPPLADYFEKASDESTI